MTHNPYSPPSAAVADLGGPDVLERPASVIYGVWLLWVAFGLGEISAVFEWFQAGNASQAKSFAGGTAGNWVSIAISIWLYSAAWRGRGWSRIAQLVLLVVALAFFFIAWRIAPQVFHLPVIDQVQLVVTSLLNVAGTGLLFAPSANAWYRAMRAQRQGLRR